MRLNVSIIFQYMLDIVKFYLLISPKILLVTYWTPFHKLFVVFSHKFELSLFKSKPEGFV